MSDRKGAMGPTNATPPAPRVHCASLSEEHMNHRLIGRLRNQHHQLEQMLRDELRRPRPDPLVIQDLKRRKLQVKDELFMAESGLIPVTVRMRHA